MLHIVDGIGSWVIRTCSIVGTFALFLFSTLSTLVTTRLKVRQVIAQMQRIGVESFTIIFITGFFTGFGLALQTYIGLSRFGGEEFIGVVVALGMSRELGPLLTGLLVIGRAGSAMTAELGTMQITEQVDALRTLCIDPYQYLIVPRVVAGTLILPFLTLFSMLFGIIGGYIYSIYVLELNPEIYLSSIQQHVNISDIVGGLIKSAVFGLILSWTGCYMGLSTTGGAQGVGHSTTQSVVIASLLILLANYFLSAFLFKVGA
ncbi:ABC transporter permease [Candidatus Dependentiae bacterium]|nr:ABC transporter permease [Candidatus Dependentiae bacterium]